MSHPSMQCARGWVIFLKTGWVISVKRGWVNYLKIKALKWVISLKIHTHPVPCYHTLRKKEKYVMGNKSQVRAGR